MTTRKTTARRRHSWGSLRRLPSGRWQASYTGPDRRRHTAPATFATKLDADTWLAQRRTDILNGTWVDPNLEPEEPEGPATFAEYATSWLAARDLRPRTRAHYEWLLESRILPTFGEVPVDAVTAAFVRRWYAALSKDTPTARAHAYALARTILGSAVDDGLLPSNPARIRGAGNARRRTRTRVLSPAELHALADEMPDNLRPMVLLAGWCSLRFGELIALTAADLNLAAATVNVDKAVYRLGGESRLGEPKTEAGVRVISIPPHIVGELRGLAKTGPLFPGAHGGWLQPSTVYRHFFRARKAIGRPDLRFHDLRHTGLTLAAVAGATQADLKARAGHSSSAAVAIYQHALEGRDRTIAEALSKLAAS